MPDNAITIYGIEDAKADLDDMAGEITRELFPGALDAGARVIESELRKRTPVAESATTSAKQYGRLVDDIDSTIRVGERGGSARTGFGDTGFVARFLEYGHAEVVGGRLTKDGHGQGTAVGFVPPDPFIRQTAESATDPATEAFLTYLADHI